MKPAPSSSISRSSAAATIELAPRPGEVVPTSNGVKIVGHLNVPGRIAGDRLALYAKNLFAFLETLIDKAEKKVAVNWEDELVKATMLTNGRRRDSSEFRGQARAQART
jgi:NAD/NADP transhydrogenase alpha subunit